MFAKLILVHEVPRIGTLVGDVKSATFTARPRYHLHWQLNVEMQFNRFFCAALKCSADKVLHARQKLALKINLI